MYRIVPFIFLILLTALLFLSCEKESPVNPKQNLPPKTYLWIQIDTSKQLASVISRQSVKWWGEDPDGIVKGFLFAFYKTDHVASRQIPDTLGYTWVTANDSLVSFPLLSKEDSFTVIVRAVDNTLKEKIDVGGIVRLNSQPYWDKNRNNIYDVDDLRLPNLKYAIDPIGATQIFSIKNSRPTVEFETTIDPLNPTEIIMVQPPETTYTVATFAWEGSDIDGDKTIESYSINLNNPNDLSGWCEFPAKNTIITIEVPRSRSANATGMIDADVYGGEYPDGFNKGIIGTVPGLRLDDTNRIYLRAKDVAGDYSQIVSLPDAKKIWYVKKPKCNLLTIINYESPPDTLLPFYRKAFAAIDTFPGVTQPRNLGDFDVLDMRTGATYKNRGIFLPFHLNPAFVRTLMLYKFVFWLTDYIPDSSAYGHSVAAYSLFYYKDAGGKVMYSTQFGYYIDATKGSLVEFAPVDRIIDTLYSTRIPNDWPIDTNSTFADSFPRLRVSPGPTVGYAYTVFVRDFIKQSGAEYIYSIPPDQNIIMPGTTRKWSKRINIGVIDVNRKFVFLTIPLHLMNGYERKWPSKPPGDGLGVPAFLKRVFIDKFGG